MSFTVGGRVRFKLSQGGPDPRRNYRAGETGEILHVFQTGSANYGSLVVELSDDRRVMVGVSQVDEATTLDRLAEL